MQPGEKADRSTKDTDAENLRKAKSNFKNTIRLKFNKKRESKRSARRKERLLTASNKSVVDNDAAANNLTVEEDVLVDDNSTVTKDTPKVIGHRARIKGMQLKEMELDTMERRELRLTSPDIGTVGCLTCRRRHAKCSRQKPACGKCQEDSYECFWKQKGTKFTDYEFELEKVEHPTGKVLNPINNSREKTSISYDETLNSKNYVHTTDLSITEPTGDISVTEIAQDMPIIDSTTKAFTMGDAFFLEEHAQLAAVSVKQEDVESPPADYEPPYSEDENTPAVDLGRPSVLNNESVPDQILSNNSSKDGTVSSQTDATHTKKIENSLVIHRISSRNLDTYTSSDTDYESDSAQDQSKIEENRLVLHSMMSDLESQADSWSNTNTQTGSSGGLPPTELLIQFQNRLKELEHSVLSSQIKTPRDETNMDWYTNNMKLQTVPDTSKSNEEALKEEISSALAIANIFASRVDKTDIEDVPVLEDAGDGINEQQLVLYTATDEPTKERKKRKRRKSKTGSKVSKRSRLEKISNNSLINIPNIEEMKLRITRLSQILQKAPIKSVAEIKEDGRRSRYQKGLLQVDTKDLPLSITRFMKPM